MSHAINIHNKNHKLFEKMIFLKSEKIGYFSLYLENRRKETIKKYILWNYRHKNTR